MRKPLITALAAIGGLYVAGLPQAGAATPEKRPPVKVYLVAGQSNAEERGAPGFLEENFPEYTKERPNLWHYRPGVKVPSPFLGDTHAAYGVEFASGCAVADAVPNDVIFMTSAVGGTTLDALLAAGLDGKAKARAESMQRSLRTTLASIDHTLAAVEHNLEAGESVLARTRIQNLEQLLGTGDARIAALKPQTAEPRHDAIEAAWKDYVELQYPSYLDVASHAKMAALAQNEQAGFVRQRAEETLAAIAAWPSYRDSFDSESIVKSWLPQWQAEKNAPLPLAVMRYLAFGDGIIWTAHYPRRLLEADDLLGEFPFSTPLAVTSDGGPVAWKYLTMDEPQLPDGWNTPGFDDSAWQESAAPVCSPTPRRKGPENKWDKPFILLRRTFEVANPAFDALRIKALVHDEADIYLNGVHVARMLTQRRKGNAFIDFDVTSAGLPALKQGTNVLAVKAVRDGGHLDIGIMGVKRP